MKRKQKNDKFWFVVHEEYGHEMRYYFDTKKDCMAYVDRMRSFSYRPGEFTIERFELVPVRSAKK